MKPKKIISDLKEASEIGNTFDLDRSIAYQSFGLPHNSIIFSGENFPKFHDLIDKLYQYSSAINESYTLKKFTGKFIEKFKDDFENNSPPDDEKINEFIKELKAEPLVEFYILREIFGITFTSDVSHIKFGDFTVYNFQTHKEPIRKLSNDNLDKIFDNNEPQYLVRYDAKARHFEKAIEIADEFLLNCRTSIAGGPAGQNQRGGGR